MSSDTLRTVGQIAGLLLFVWTIYKGGLRLFRVTIGSRQEALLKLHRISCGVTTEYAEAILGPPIYRTRSGQYEERIYFLHHAWVQLLINEDMEVVRLAVTVTDKKFRFSTTEHSLGAINIRLGFDFVTRIESAPMSAWFFVGARRAAYIETYYEGNPGGYQHFATAHNELSDVGGFDIVSLTKKDIFAYATGIFEHLEDVENSSAEHAIIESRSTFVPNTFIILDPSADESCFLQNSFGPDYDRIRLLPKVNRSRWSRFLNPD